MIRFGDDFELDRAAYQLRRSGHALKLERIPMEILLLLTERRGQLVTREQIVERIWGKDRFLDTDNSINGAIRKLRQVLKDDSGQPRFIETVTARGYRFIAPVHEPQGSSVESPAPPPSPRAWRARAAALVLLVALATAAGVLWSRTRTPPAAAGRVTLAVLPFQNLTGDAGQEYLSDGLTEEMIAQLGAIDPQRLQVIARTSVMRYKTGQAPLQRIARELGVQYVLEGSVRRDGNDVRVTAQLIQTKGQTHIWAQQYDRELKDLLALQGEIAQRIATEIRAALGGDTLRAGPPAVGAVQAYEAYDLYLKGLHFFNKRTVPDFERAIAYFEQATVADPGYARAYALLADSYTLLAAYRMRPPRDLVSKARGAALKALEIDRGSAEAHTAYALIVQNHGWDWQTAEGEFRRAIELNPNYATAHHWYAEHLMWRGRFDEALRESERARQLDPLSLIIAVDDGAILYAARQHDRAIARLRSVLEVDPNFPRAADIMGNAYLEKGMTAVALADVERRRPEIGHGAYWGSLVCIYGRSGQTAKAREALREALRFIRRDSVDATIMGATHACAGDHEQALAWLEKAYADRANGLTGLKVSPHFDSLRADARFQSLLRRVGLAP